MNFIEDNDEVEKDTVYSIGTEIAEGVGTSLVIGFSAIDPDLTYEIETSNDEFTAGGHTWPIIDVSVIVESKVLSNPKITFVLMLEIDQITEYVVGTVKNIKSLLFCKFHYFDGFSVHG